MGRIPVDKKRIDNSLKQQAIIAAVASHYMSKGIKAISTDELCKIAGKSKATIYKYFDSRKEIVQQILITKIEQLAAFHAVLVDQNIEYLERYKQAVTIATLTVKDMSSLFLSDLADLFPDLFAQIVQIKKQSIDLLKAFYADGIKAGAFINVNPEILAINDELFFDALVNPNFLKSRNIDLKDAFEGYFKIRFEGIIKK